jgi:hypothetical protein
MATWGTSWADVAKPPPAFVAQLDRNTKSSCSLLLSVPPYRINHSGSVFHYADVELIPVAVRFRMTQV